MIRGAARAAVGEPADHVVHEDGRLLEIDTESCLAGECFRDVRRLTEGKISAAGPRDRESFYIMHEPSRPDRGFRFECWWKAGCLVEVHRFDGSQVQSRRVPAIGLPSYVLHDSNSDMFYLHNPSFALLEYPEFPQTE